MEINLLQSYFKVKDTLKNAPTTSSNPRGQTMAEIEVLEQELNNGEQFPKAFREYLYIGGKYDAIGFEGPVEGVFDKMTKGYKTLFNKNRSIKIQRPIVIFDVFEDEGFMFIYLDEGDDPQPWNSSLLEDYDSEDGEMIWKVPHPTFSDMVNTLVGRALDGQVPW